MSNLIKTGDVTTVNYEDKFYYTINVSFNGISGGISSAKIVEFLPSAIDVDLPQAKAPIKSITTTDVEGGKEITIDFGAITDLGVAANIELGCQYNLSATNKTSFQNTAKLYINETLHAQASAEPVLLDAVPMYQLQCNKILPETVNPTPGQSVYLKFTLENFGDLGVEIENIVISAPLPTGTTYDTSFTIVGHDKTQGVYADNSADGITGIVENGVLTFEIPHYRGTIYEIIFKMNLSSSLYVGQQLFHQAQWSIDGTSQIQSGCVLTLAGIIRSVSNGIYGADYTMPSQHINYELYINNQGNSNLTNFMTVDELPNEIDFYSLETGTFQIEAINQPLSGSYYIGYTTNEGTTGSIGPFNANVNTTVLFSDISIPSGEKIVELSWQLPVMVVGLSQNIPPKLNGIVKSSISQNTTILNHIHSDWDGASGTQIVTANKTTMVQNLCVLRPSLQVISNQTVVYPGSVVRYKATVDCTSSRLENPIVAFLLPSELEFSGGASAYYYSYFQNEPNHTTPEVQVFSNFAQTGKTLVKWQYSGEYSSDFWQRTKIEIEFDVVVTVGAVGSASINMLLGTSSNNGIIPSGVDVYADTNDIAQNGLSSMLYAQSDFVAIPIQLITIISSKKMVKGMLDSEFKEGTDLGLTLEGGDIFYKILISNHGNVDFNSVEIVDVFPHIGDTGVIETSQFRLSEYTVYNMGQVSASIYPIAQGQSEPIISVYYSKSYDPIRFGGGLQEMGTVDDWSVTAPEISTEVASFKVMTENTVLMPGQTLEVLFMAVAPLGTQNSQVAWNTFASKISYYNSRGTLTYMLPVEPEKVGVQVTDPEFPGKIGGLIWNDVDKNGIYETGEAGVDDVVMVLYNENGTPLQSKITAPNKDSESGFYVFNNLPEGKYFVRMIFDQRKTYITPQNVYEFNGNKFDPQTALTPMIDINITAERLDVFGGIGFKTITDQINQVLEFNKSANKMVRNAIYNQMLLVNKLEDVTDISKL